MNDVERIAYLKNVLAIAHADNVLSAEEERQIEEIRLSIGATKTQLRKARKELEGHEINLDLLNRYSFRIRNLEDMIEMALVDGVVQEEEKKVLTDAAKASGMGQNQINVLLKEAKQRRKLSVPICPDCGASAKGGTKFCPECGSSLTGKSEVKGKAIDLAVPDWGITIAFADSTAAGFPKALKHAQSLETYQKAERSGKQWHAVTVRMDDMSSLLPVAKALAGIRNSESYLCGKLCDWQELFGYIRCADERDKSYKPVEYCFGVDDGRFNVWGCKQLGMDWTSWSEWFTYGKFIDAKNFQFDHERIKHEIQNKMQRVQLCPYIQPDFIQAVINRLPAKVSVDQKSGWEYRESYEPDPRAISVVVIRDYGGGFREKKKIKAIGVQPRESTLAVDLVMKAAKDCGRRGLNRRSLLTSG